LTSNAYGAGMPSHLTYLAAMKEVPIFHLK
jgi:hypothetical protein